MMIPWSERPWPKGPYLYPHSKLRTVAKPVPQDPRYVYEVACQMIDMMNDLGGVGLAAPQVGLPWNMFVTTFGVFLDPQVDIGPNPQPVTMEEGCLSLPGRFEKITRPATIMLSSVNLQGGRRFTRLLVGLAARIVQHEMDHLKGILFIDHLEKP